MLKEEKIELKRKGYCDKKKIHDDRFLSFVLDCYTPPNCGNYKCNKFR